MMIAADALLLASPTNEVSVTGKDREVRPPPGALQAYNRKHAGLSQRVINALKQ